MISINIIVKLKLGFANYHESSVEWVGIEGFSWGRVHIIDNDVIDHGFNMRNIVLQMYKLFVVQLKALQERSAFLYFWIKFNKFDPKVKKKNRWSCWSRFFLSYSTLGTILIDNNTENLTTILSIIQCTQKSPSIFFD